MPRIEANVPAAVTSVQAPTEPPPLGGDASIALDVPGYRPAIVAVPTKTRRARPVVVALHGNFDRPEWQCGVWQPIVGDSAFVLCPRGIPRRDAPAALDRWEYASGKAMQRELEAALGALKARFGNFVDDGPLLFIGFSLGAIYGAAIVQAEPMRFARVVFIEGGLGAWSSNTAKKFVRGGGQRLILACGQPDCLSRVKTLGPALERAGLPTRTGGSAKAGHSYDGEVAEVVRSNWQWLTEDDPRFAP